MRVFVTPGWSKTLPLPDSGGVGRFPGIIRLSTAQRDFRVLVAQYQALAGSNLATFWKRTNRWPPMIVLVLLLASWLMLRGIGAMGVPSFATWHDSARYALVVMFVFTATAHFNKMRHDLAEMVPTFFPHRLTLVYITGVLELLGAAGLLIPNLRVLAAKCLIVLLIGMFVANVNAARKGVTLRGKPATPLWMRTPMQALFIAFLWWSTRA